jgi:hypothetical protein
MKTEEIVIKLYRVIHSCKTMDQLRNAYKYLQLATDNGYIAEELRVAIYLSFYTNKSNELKK